MLQYPFHADRIPVQYPPAARRALLIVGDTFAVLIAVWAAFAIRLGEVWPELLPEVAWLFPLSVAVVIPTFMVVGVYRPILRYADESLLYTILLAVSAGILLMMAAWVLMGEGLWLRSFWLICWLVLAALVGGGGCCCGACCVGGFAGRRRAPR